MSCLQTGQPPGLWSITAKYRGPVRVLEILAEEHMDSDSGALRSVSPRKSRKSGHKLVPDQMFGEDWLTWQNLCNVCHRNGGAVFAVRVASPPSPPSRPAFSKRKPRLACCAQGQPAIGSRQKLPPHTSRSEQACRARFICDSACYVAPAARQAETFLYYCSGVTVISLNPKINQAARWSATRS